MRHRPTTTRLIGAAASIFVLGSCGDGTEEAAPGPPVQLEVVSGDGQTGVVGDPLSERLAVRVLDAAGLPVSGARVSWELVPEGGSLERSSSTTDGVGIAENAWRLGTQAGEQVGRVWLPGAPTAEFVATAAPGAPTTARLIPERDALLVHEARAFQVALFDRYGNPVDPGAVALTWTTGDPGVARVDSRGIVRGVGPGTTRVEVSAGAEAAAEIEVVRLSPKRGTRTVSGTASLPAGEASSGAYVTTLLGGAAPIEGGGFRVEVARDAATVILLMEDRRIQGMAVAPAPMGGSAAAGPSVEIDAGSTAASLLYITPPFGLAPAEISRELLDVIRSLPETEALARVIASRSDVEGRVPGSDDREYRAAFLEAYHALVASLRSGRSGGGVPGTAGGHAAVPSHFGLEFSEPRLDRSGTYPAAELNVRNHALRWVSVYRRPDSGSTDPVGSAEDRGWILIPAASPCILEIGSAADWFNRCWSGQALGDPRGSHELRLTFAPDRPGAVLSVYGPGSGNEVSNLPPDPSEALWIPTVMTYAEWVLGSVAVPLTGARSERMLAAGADTETLESAEEVVRWLADRAEALPTLDRCLRHEDGIVDGLCVKERLFRHGGDEAWNVFAELGRRLVPSVLAQFTDEELRWLRWRANLVGLTDRTAGVLAQMPPEADRPLLRAVTGPIRADLHLGYNELMGATAISIRDGDGRNGRAVYPGESLPDPPVVRVTGGNGNPVAGAWVAWEVDPGHGSVGGASRSVTETDAEGIATVDWILAEGEEHQSLTARLAGYETSVEFTATVFRWDHITTSEAHTCGLNMRGEAYCWGTGSGGTLATGAERRGPGPFAVFGELAFTQLSAGRDHTCGLTEDGTVYCWGVGRLGRLGTGSEETEVVPAPVLSDRRSFLRITANHSHTCALADDGRAYCWGRGVQGQLGTGSSGAVYHETVPTPVEGGLRFSQLAAGSAHTCALTRDGRAHCWGWGIWGRLGTGSTLSEAEPAPVATDLTFAQVVSGTAHSCALTEEGEAYCWGYGWEGQLGTGHSGRGYEERTPAAVSGDLRFVQLTAGSYHTCGVTREGEAYCWGSGPSLGAGSPEDRAVPTPVRGDHRFVRLAAGMRRTCGVTVEGRAYCWAPGLSVVSREPGEADRFEPVRMEPPRA